jgi:hypothetical protein
MEILNMNMNMGKIGAFFFPRQPAVVPQENKAPSSAAAPAPVDLANLFARVDGLEEVDETAKDSLKTVFQKLGEANLVQNESKIEFLSSFDVEGNESQSVMVSLVPQPYNDYVGSIIERALDLKSGEADQYFKPCWSDPDTNKVSVTCHVEHMPTLAAELTARSTQ